MINLTLEQQATNAATLMHIFNDVHETLSAAARVAESLRLRAHRLTKDHVEQEVEREEAAKPQDVPKGGRTIVDRIQRAINAFCE